MSFVGDAISSIADAGTGLLGSLGSAAGGLLSGVTGGLGQVIGGNQVKQGTKGAVNQADPLLSYAPYFADQTYNLWQNPSLALTGNPAYNFELTQGQQAVQGSAAASGMLNSGNTLSSLDKFGQGLASQSWQQLFGDAAGIGGGQPALASLLSSGSTANALGQAGGLGSLLSGLGFSAGAGGGGGGLGGLLSSLFGGGGAAAGSVGAATDASGFIDLAALA